jgi:hypothetical protein
MELSQVISVAQIVITAVLGIVTILQIYVTYRLNIRVRLLDLQLDQSIQRLHRAREAVISRQKAYVYLLEYVKTGREASEPYFERHADWSAYQAELRGLAFAIDDKELLDLVNNGERDSENPTISEINARHQAQLLHTRIAQLLKEETNNRQKSKGIL